MEVVPFWDVSFRAGLAPQTHVRVQGDSGSFPALKCILFVLQFGLSSFFCGPNNTRTYIQEMSVTVVKMEWYCFRKPPCLDFYDKHANICIYIYIHDTVTDTVI